MTIGRRSRSRGVEPEIDLSGPPLDPGVSTLHAVLLAAPDGGWDLVDVGSRNGTVVNGHPDPIAPNAPVRLAVGDRIMIGAWTVLTVQDGSVAVAGGRGLGHGVQPAQPALVAGGEAAVRCGPARARR